MKEISFTKMCAAGNDFILIDNRRNILPPDFHLSIPHLCRRHFGIGADGVMIVEDSPEAHFRMRFFNPDGREAEMCGNGARCVARFAYSQGIAPSKMVFQTTAGQVEAEVEEEGVKVRLMDPADLRTHISLRIEGREREVHFIRCGVPHAVMLVENLEKVDVSDLGRAIRYHPFFHPQGTNADFVRVEGEQEIKIRTYERGVEEETLACGTGAVASSLIAALLEKVCSPVSVHTRGGIVLRVYFKKLNSSFSQIFLEGDARFVFEGRVEI